MTTSPKQVPVLLIEDEPTHVKQIREHLSPRFAVEPLSSFDHQKIFNYKSVNPDSQIVIVDLNLGASKDFRPEEGLELIKDELWPVDRTTLFIVFSVHIQEKNLEALLNLKTPEPHWTFVQKELVDGRLTIGSLQSLETVVEWCSKFASPILPIPRYDSYRWTEPINTYLHSVEGKTREHHHMVERSILASIHLLNDMSEAAAVYVKAGAQAQSLAIGVYGSFGRLESRQDSDVEFSVYFDSDVVPRITKLAVQFYNRMMSYLRIRGILFEGQVEIQKNENGLLDLRQVNVDILPNGYRPVISKERIVKANLSTDPHIRNRHFQTLTELRPVFNPAYLMAIKKEILFQNIAPNVSDVLKIVQHPYLMEITDQFFTDAKPKSLKTWKDLKTFCYRTLNVIALRFYLIGVLAFEDGTLRNEAAWEGFLDRLCEPGLVKIVRFANQCADDFKPDKMEGQAIKRELNNVIQAYFLLFSSFSHIETDLANAQTTDIDIQATLSQSGVRDLIRFLVNTLKLIAEYSFFDPHRSQVSTRWLFSTEKIERLASDL